MSSPKQANNTSPIGTSIGPRYVRICRTVGAIFFLAGTILAWPEIEFRYWTSQSLIAMNDRQFEDALGYLKRAIAIKPRHAETHFGIARCYRHRGEMNLVRTYLESALRCGLARTKVEREEWLALAQSGQMREAGPHLAELLENAGEDGQDICEAFVNGFFQTNRFDRGFELLEVWQKQYPDDAQPFLFRGRYLEAYGSSSVAANAYRDGLKKAPERLDLKIGLARCLNQTHEHAESSQILQTLRIGHPRDPEILNLLATNLMERGLLNEARRVLSELQAIAPKHPNARLLLGQLHLQSSQSDEAVEVLGRLAAERPFDVNARYAYARALLAHGESEKASDEFRFVSTAREELTHARSLVETVNSKEPNNVELRHKIGVLLLQYESPDAGAGWLRSVLEIAPNHGPTHARLADYYKSMNNIRLERSHRQRALALQDDLP